MSKKYVNFRLEGATNIEAINQYLHDIRLHSPKYVKTEETKRNKAIGIGTDFNLLRKEGDNFKKPTKLFNEYNELQKTRIKEKTGRTAQKTAEFFNCGILTFSDNMIEDYQNNPELFEQLSKNFLRDLEDKFGFRVMLATLHLDEKVPHIHVIFDNISIKGKGIRRNIRPNDLSNIQTMMGQHFAEMGYMRGEKVEDNKLKPKHLSVKELHSLNAVYKALQAQISDLSDKKDTMRELIRLMGEKDPKTLQIIDFIKDGVEFEDLPEKAQEKIHEFSKSLLSNNRPK